MMSSFLSILRSSAVLLLVMTVLLGIAYPLTIMGIAQGFYPHRANGSLIVRDGKVIGSELLGQQFDNEWFFWGRPSVTQPAYNATGSGGSNLSTSNRQLQDSIRSRIAMLQRVDARNKARIPIDLVTASASGLDPHISLPAAEYQLPRVAAARNMKQGDIRPLIEQNTESFGFGTLGTPYVNVLKLNIALDDLAKRRLKK